MVWLHGGGFSSGSANGGNTDGTNLALNQDVVVIGVVAVRGAGVRLRQQRRGLLPHGGQGFLGGFPAIRFRHLAVFAKQAGAREDPPGVLAGGLQPFRDRRIL